MNRTKRILALSLILCLLLGCAAGFTACSSAKVLFTVDGVGVTDGYFSFYMSQYLSAMASDLGDNMISSSDMIDESTTAGDYVKDIIYESIVNDYATIALGEEIGVTMSSKDYETAETYKTAYIAQLEAAGTSYKQMIKNLGCTNTDVELFCRNASLLSRISEALYADGSTYYPSESEIENITKDFHENYICITYVIQSVTDTTGAVLNDTELQLSRDRCTAAREGFLKGDDDEKVVQDYSEDASGRESPYTIYFTLDSITDEVLLKGIRNLKIGDVTDIMETSNGMMVAKRLPLDDKQIDTVILDYMSKNIESRTQMLADGLAIYQTAEYSEYYLQF
ncbi:MAG: hypothetical protein IJC53_00285 [Clostridia bacterium]|nr:hypothetical protein [Clostridia bacterium]